MYVAGYSNQTDPAVVDPSQTPDLIGGDITVTAPGIPPALVIIGLLLLILWVNDVEGQR